MGSPLSAPLANLFLCHHEVKWLDDCPSDFKPLFYRRYVDDTFLVFNEKEHIDRFCDYLNSKHGNIKFTKEYESQNKLSFLDINVNKLEQNNQTSFSLNVFRKRTFTGLGLNFHSYTYRNFKINNIRTLIFRAYRLCTTWIDFNTEVTFLIKYFKDNGYPENIVYSTVKRFLDSVFITKPEVLTVDKMVMYIKMPLGGLH